MGIAITSVVRQKVNGIFDAIFDLETMSITQNFTW